MSIPFYKFLLTRDRFYLILCFYFFPGRARPRAPGPGGPPPRGPAPGIGMRPQAPGAPMGPGMRGPSPAGPRGPSPAGPGVRYIFDKLMHLRLLFFKAHWT